MFKNLYKRAPVNTLFLKLSMTFLVILVVLATLYITISVNAAQRYYDEINQSLNRTIAHHITADLPPIIDGVVNKPAMERLFHNAMVLNPHLEIYLLDTQGTILTYSAPDSIILMKRIPVGPIQAFIADTTNSFFLGPDPRSRGTSKAFSAFPVYENRKFVGYIYVILASKEYESVANGILGSYILRLSLRFMVISLIAALIVGLIAIWFLTRSFREIVRVIGDFRTGDVNIRMQTKGKGSMALIAETFNQMADRVNSYAETIQTMEKNRRQLVASISHDLRTPLATIQGYVETLSMKKQHLTEEQQERYLTIIQSGTHRLQRLVEDLFELSTLEANETPLQTEPFSFADLVGDNAARCQLSVKEKQITLNVNVAPDLPLVTGDIRYIDRVLQNLFDNAVKYCDINGTIQSTLLSDGQEVTFRISNTGVGIDPKDLPHLFDAYHTGKRTKKNIPQSDNSTGLGLAIVKKILQKHESTITVESVTNGITEFTFSLKTAA